MKSFSQKVLKWFDQQGRKNLPWQQDINPYRVWVSEIMLQQTQVKTVIPYYERFMQSFPTVQALASAEQDEVLKHWSGLGYYARARNMHKSAKQVCDDFAGNFPETLDEIVSLSGIGRSTGAAILSISHGQKQAILDGNVKRVLARAFVVEGWPGKSTVLKKLWEIADTLVPDSRNADYTQAMMDLGATVCTRTKPTCDNCPLQDDCLAHQQGNQTDYPTKKPKKTLPEKHTVMLLLQNEVGEVFMQKRPPVGIWGSLWCFPQFETEALAKEYLIENYQYDIDHINSLAVLSHTFSHFRLHIQPLIIQIETPLKLGVMEAKDSLWYNSQTEFNGGLAAPVQLLLNILFSTSKG
jgi:A/G-specific adenine glycosylase